MPARSEPKILYLLDEALLLRLPGVLAGYESWVEIAKYGDKKLSFLRRFRPFKEGTPSHDQLGDLVTALEAARFQRCYIAWVSSFTGLEEDVVAIDGKTLRRSCQKGKPRRRST